MFKWEIGYMNLKNQFQKNIYRVTSSKKADIQKCNRELENVYNALLFHTIDTLKQLDATDILDIWVIVNLMCQNGCFSYNRNEWNDCLSNNSSKSLEILVKHKLFLNGHGVCRHISMLLQKIYYMMGYESDVCLGFFNILESKEQKEQIMKIMEVLSSFKLSSGMREKVVKAVSATNIRNEHMKKITSLGSIREGNHLISRANFNGATLMLDAYNGEIYTQATRDLFLPQDCGFSKLLRDERDICFMPYIKQNNHICDEFGIQKISENYDYPESLFDKEIKLARRNYGCIEAVDTYKDFHKTHLNELYELESHLQKVLRKKY